MRKKAPIVTYRRPMRDLVDPYGDVPRLPPEPRELSEDELLAAPLYRNRFERPFPRYDK